MLLSIENEVVNAFIEPQFKNIGTANLVTIQFGAWESVPELRRRIQGDVRFDHRQRYFEFTGFTNFLTLRELCGKKHLQPADLYFAENVTPWPAAFEWEGWELDEEDSHGNVVSEGQHWSGYCLPGELESVQNDQGLHFQFFNAYPLFKMPLELELGLGLTNLADSN